ncbi:MAG: LysR family transcriptional regulator [Chloroflexi bacterium]|nr:MAG: LysR family transcriptional regulator [Chloroflexota bacterium]
MLDVYELNVFLIAAETENFSEAARQLSLTQPAVSMQIRALEKKLGVELFHRAGRSLALTEQGRALIPLAREMINRAIQIEEAIESLKGEVVGHLKVGCSTTTGKYFLPQLAARFRSRFPGVQMTIYNHGRERVLSELCDGQVQLAVVSAAPMCREAEYRHFFVDHVVLVVPANHPWAQREVVAPEELRNAEFIMRDEQSGTREEVETMLHEVGLSIDDLKVVMEIGNSEAISMAVEEGIGVTFISRTVARRGIQLGRLKEVNVDGLSLRRDIYIAYSRRHPATQAQTEFWNFIQEPENVALLEQAM